MNLRVVATGVAIASMTTLVGCGMGPKEYSIDGLVNRMRTYDGAYGRPGGMYFSVDDDIKTYKCEIDDLSECASIREGDTISATIRSGAGEEKVVIIHSVQKAHPSNPTP